jgi:hypothetical protein
MNAGWLVAVIAVAAVFTVLWRRRRGLPRGSRVFADRPGGVIKRVEAYSFPVLGALLVVGALVFWETWVSLGGIAIGLLFLVTGASALRDVRRRRVES